MLLTQELRRGFYADFLSDVRMLPTDASSDGSTSGAASYDALFSPELTSPPLGWFRGATTSDDTSCPPYRSTVAALAAASGAVRPRLCLAEYFRDTGFDQFESYGGKPERGLGSSPAQFPGKPYSRLDVYRAVMVDPRATPDDRALALNRAIRCYGPSGYNSCGGAEASKDERRSWFVRLKRDHAASHWAQSLKLYW